MLRDVPCSSREQGRRCPPRLPFFWSCFAASATAAAETAVPVLHGAANARRARVRTSSISRHPPHTAMEASRRLSHGPWPRGHEVPTTATAPVCEPARSSPARLEEGHLRLSGLVLPLCAAYAPESSFSQHRGLLEGQSSPCPHLRHLRGVLLHRPDGEGRRGDALHAPAEFHAYPRNT